MEEFEKTADEKIENEVIRPEFQENLNKIKSLISDFIKKDDDDEDGHKKTKYVRNIFESINRLIKAKQFPVCESEKENQELLRYLEELETQNVGLDGDSIVCPYGVIGTMLYKGKMDKDDILELIKKRKEITFVSGILESGGSEILGFVDVENDLIIDFGKDILEEIYVYGKDTHPEMSFSLDEWKTHTAYIIWNPLGKYLKLDQMSFEEIIALGLRYNESYLWRELITKRNKSIEDINKLSHEERLDVAQKIAVAYAPLVGIDTTKSDFVDQVKNFGGPVSGVIDLLTKD